MNSFWQFDNSIKIAIIGECMLEMSQDQSLHYSYAGDTLNTAIYLSRQLSDTTHRVDYVTALGDDPFSDEMVAQWRNEGLGVDHVARVEGKLPGLYWVKTDDVGERSFYYWRSQSAARELIKVMPQAEILQALQQHSLVCLSGISVAILDQDDQQTLLQVISQLHKEGGKIIFDTNYRPKLWASVESARQSMQKFLRVVDVALVSFEDEQALFGDQSIEHTVHRLQNYGVGEIVVKNGVSKCLASINGEQCAAAPQKAEKQVDTTAAGDSFNAAYIAARLQSATVTQALAKGHQLAAKVVQHRGAIIPVKEFS